MAWYAMYKWFLPFRTTAYTNWIHVYQKELSATYLSRLTEMQKAYDNARASKRRKGDILCQVIEKIKH